MRHTTAAIAGVVLLAGCGSSNVVMQGDPVAHPYTGPMSLKQDFSDDATVLERSGAAGLAALPKTATDTGYHRDGRELWLSAKHEAAYLVSLSDPDDVERWPAAKQEIYCA